MSRTRTVGLLVALVAIAVLLAFWAASEARAQRRETETALRNGAALLAGALVPALAAASATARELDEVVAWKLLDNARLLGRLDVAGTLDDGTFQEILRTNGLDAALVLDALGHIRRRAGTEVPPELIDRRVREVAAGVTDEAVLGWSSDPSGGHVAVAAARPDGGAVLVQTDAGIAYAFARRLGVARLLEDIVGTGGVLYLVFHEEPGGIAAEACWDSGSPPGPPAEHDALGEVRGRPSLELSFPVPEPAGSSATLRVGLDAAPLLRASASATRRTALVGVLLTAFALAVAATALVSRARAVERVDAARRLARAEEVRQRTERLAAAGTLAAGIAHEVRNPLNAIGLAAQRIQRHHRGDEACGEFARRIRGEVQRLEGIVKGFLDLARPAAGPRVSTDLADLASEVVALVQEEASTRAIRIVVDAKAAAAVVDREAVRRAMLNLVRNALAVSPEGGQVTVTVERAGSRIRVRVRDQGPGVDPALAPRVFDPFVTTRADGTGLGLPLVRQVAMEHGGEARLESRPGGGAEAVLELQAVGRNE